MTKNTEKLNQHSRYKVIIAIVLVVISVVTLATLLAQPHPSKIIAPGFTDSQRASYFKKIIEKFESPTGLEIKEGSDDLREGGPGGVYASRTYTYTGDREDTNDKIATRLQELGFSNASWKERGGLFLNSVPSVSAICDGAFIAVRMEESNTNLRIEVFGEGQKDAPACPIL
jgi:hypothetical protein